MPGTAGLVLGLGLVARAGLGGLVLVTFRPLDPNQKEGQSVPALARHQGPSGQDLLYLCKPQAASVCMSYLMTNMTDIKWIWMDRRMDGWMAGWMEVCKYASIQVYKYKSMKEYNNVSMQVCKYASMQVCYRVSTKA